MSRATRGGKHRRILEAAVKVFAQKGFFNARVSEIAREAEVADDTIYLYFKNKDDILIRLFEEEMDSIIQGMLTEVGPLEDPLEKLRAFVRRHLRMVEQNPSLAEVIQVELRQSNKFMKDYENRKFKEYLNLVAEIIREGQRRGVIRPDIHPGVAKRVIFGALDEMSTYWLFSQRKTLSAEEAAQQISDLLIRGVMRPDPDEEARGISSNP